MPDSALEINPSTLLVKKYRIPAIVAYNRLEPNPRSSDFERSLRAEVRDALWMLCRQWQFGEFQGEDAATPVSARILGEHTPMDRVGFPGGRILPYNEQVPLEAVIEREPLKPDLYLAVQMGLYYLRLMRAKSLISYLARLVDHYPLTYSIDRNDTEAQQLQKANQGRRFDGFKLYLDSVTVDSGESRSRFALWLDAPANGDISATDKASLLDAAQQLAGWFLRVYSQAEQPTDSAWLSSQLDYQTSIASPPQPAQRVLLADQYVGGHLDWYSFDLAPAGTITLPGEQPGEASVQEIIASFIPSPIAFKGMPNPRFWAMEDSQTDFGKIDTSATGLIHLMFAEFGLVYSNDWFMLPYPLGINTLCEIKGVVITDVFGEHVLIRPAGRGAEDNWQRWAMFHHTERGARWTGSSLFYLAPAVTKSLEGDPLESVTFLRDEMANMVWAVETIVPSQSGEGVNGNEMALLEKRPEPFTPAGNAVIRYILGTEVPDNWIPFVPVHVEGSDTEIRLQRARLPSGKGALGQVLTEKQAPYFINEEEVPRAGIIVQRVFQRTRWINGKTYLWIGRSKAAGKGEGWSNLAFDQIVDIPPAKNGNPG